MLSLSYTSLCCILPNTIWQIKHKRKKMLSHMIWTYIFMIYVALALYVAEIGSVWDIISNGQITGKINTHPFAPGGLIPDILNIIMFMPLGFLLPLIWVNFRRCSVVALTGLGFSALIEFLQLFNDRISDVDDLIMNTFGACAGYFLWRIFGGVIKTGKPQEMTRAEPITYIILGILGVCVFCNWSFVESL